MNRKLKTLGLTLVAVFAVSAVAASAASATAFNFKAESVPLTLTGNQHAGNDVLTIDAGAVSCTGITYHGEHTNSTATVSETVTPSYTGCTAFGFVNVPIDVNGCAYKFIAVTKEGANFEGSVDIVCGANPITITAPGCTVTVGSQTGLKKVTYTNVGTGSTKEVTVDVAITGLAYEEHNKGIFPTCAANTVKKTNGKYEGASLFTGESPGTSTHFGLSVE